MDGSLFERGKALEDHFFGEKDKQLLEQLRQEISHDQERCALHSAIGIDDEAVLDALVDHHVTAESLSSLGIVPLVAVAWADGTLQQEEREAILRAAESTGIARETAGYRLIETWLENRPPSDLLESWKLYVSALKENLDDAAFRRLGTTVIGRAKEIATAAGGILGFGKISESESRVIHELEQAFE